MKKKRTKEFDGERWQEEFAEEISREYGEEDLIRVWEQLKRTLRTVELAIIEHRRRKHSPWVEEALRARGYCAIDGTVVSE